MALAQTHTASTIYPPSNTISVNPSILSDTSTLTLAKAAAQTVTNTVTVHRGLKESQLTAVIVVPIVILAMLSPILIVWFLGYRRRRKAFKDLYQSPQKLKSPANSQNPSICSYQNVKFQPQTFHPTQSTLDLVTQSRPPTRRPRKANQLRTSHIQNRSLSGFHFGFSRRATMFTFRSTQAPSMRRPGAVIWDTPPPYASLPLTFAHPFIPSPLQPSQLHESPLPVEGAISPISPTDPTPVPPTYTPFPRPQTYGRACAGSPRSPSLPKRTALSTPSTHDSLSTSNLSAHNAANLQRPFSQPATVAISDISGLSYDQSLWSTTQQAQGAGREKEEDRGDDAISEASAREHHPGHSVRPHQMV